jgi:hypothetical protein
MDLNGVAGFDSALLRSATWELVGWGAVGGFDSAALRSATWIVDWAIKRTQPSIV